MAKRTDISYRYATAWLEAAEERGVLARVREEIDGFEELIAESEDFASFLQNRSLPAQVKQSLLTRLFQGKIQEITLNFLFVLTAKKRERLFADILAVCHILLDARDGIVNAEVTGAVAMTDAQTTVLQTKLESYTGKRIRLSVSMEPDLIGGFFVRVGDVVFDSSLRSQLQRMRQALVGR